MVISLLTCSFAAMCTINDGCLVKTEPLVVTVTFDDQAEIAELLSNPDAEPIPVLIWPSVNPIVDPGMRFVGGGGIIPGIMLSFNSITMTGTITFHINLIGPASAVGPCELSVLQ